MNFILRIKHKSGQSTIDSLTSLSLVKELKNKICIITSIDVNKLHILNGYPPKPLIANNDETISQAGIRSGDTILVEEQKNPITSLNDKLLISNPNLPTTNPNISEFKLQRYTVPANNSCLFTSIDFILNGGTKINLNSAPIMRKLIASVVASRPDYYTEAFLGKLNIEYQRWICDNNQWGGAIEISILSQHHSIEIAVIDIETGQLYRYGENENYPTRIFLIYDGIHYDPIIALPISSPSFTKNKRSKIENPKGAQTIFLNSDDLSLVEALQMAQQEKKARKFTNINSAAFKCLVCGNLLEGQHDLQKHSLETKHSNFAQI